MVVAQLGMSLWDGGCLIEDKPSDDSFPIGYKYGGCLIGDEPSEL